MVMAAVREWSLIAVISIKDWPTLLSERRDARKVGKQSGRLRIIDLKLALVADDGDKVRVVSNQLPDLWQLPNSGLVLSRSGSSQVFWVFK